MKFKDLKTDQQFYFLNERKKYIYRGNGWYATTTGYDGGPWHIGYQDGGPWHIGYQDADPWHIGYQDADPNPEVTLVATIQLRSLTETQVKNDTSLLNLPIVFEGELIPSRQYAADHGFTWITKDDYIFGGYYVNNDGDCLMPT